MTDHTLDASVVVDLEGNLQQQARRYENTLQNMSRNGSRHMGRLQRTTQRLDTTMSRLGNRWVALATGGSVVAAGAQVIKIEERFERLGIQANKSSKDMSALKYEIYAAANAANTRINASELTSAVEEIVEKTGDLDFARQNLENLALTISATAAEGKAIGGIAAEFQKMGIVEIDDVREALDILITQGKEGAFTLQNLAALGPRVVTAYTSMGRTGIPAIRELGAALQVIRMATGNSEQAATSFEALMRVFSDAEKIKMLQNGGIQLFDPEQLKQGKEVLRPVHQIIAEIVKRADGRKSVLDSVIGDSEALRSFNQAVTEFNATGEIASLTKFYSIQANGNNLLNDSQRAAQTAAGSMRMLHTAWKEFADRELAEPIKSLADTLDSIDSAEMRETLDTVKDIAIATGTAIVGLKLLNKGAGVLAKRNNGGGALGDAASNMAPIPVFVVNNIAGGGMPGGAGGSKPGTGHAGKAGRLAKLGGVLTFLGGATGSVLGAGMLGYGAGSILNELIEGTAFHDWVGATAARTWAAFGSEEAQAAVNANGDAHSVYGSGYAKVELELSPEASKALKPKKAEAKELELDINGTVEGM